MTDARFLLHSDRHYVIEQCVDCPLPGYLIVRPVSGATSMEELTTEEHAALGGVLAKAIDVVKKVVRPVRVYCAQFGETDGPLHFHVFPRTEEVTREYLSENPLREGIIDGPDLLSWYRRKHGHDESEADHDKVVHEIREVLNVHEGT